MLKLRQLFILVAVIFVSVLVVYYKLSLNQSRLGNDQINIREVGDAEIVGLSDGVILTNLSDFQSPLEQSGKRVEKKPFGIFITQQTSPVQPERFQGYHTGTDFEVFPEEQDVEIFVKAVCSGELLEKKWASGYGGVVIQRCPLDGAGVTVLYGHLNLESIAGKIGDKVAVGDSLGILGQGFTDETDGERKHLHLSIHSADVVSLLGYVAKEEDLKNWIDPCPHVCR